MWMTEGCPVLPAPVCRSCRGRVQLWQTLVEIEAARAHEAAASRGVRSKADILSRPTRGPREMGPAGAAAAVGAAASGSDVRGDGGGGGLRVRRLPADLTAWCKREMVSLTSLIPQGTTTTLQLDVAGCALFLMLRGKAELSSLITQQLETQRLLGIHQRQLKRMASSQPEPAKPVRRKAPRSLKASAGAESEGEGEVAAGEDEVEVEAGGVEVAEVSAGPALTRVVRVEQEWLVEALGLRVDIYVWLSDGREVSGWWAGCERLGGMGSRRHGRMGAAHAPSGTRAVHSTRAGIQAGCRGRAGWTGTVSGTALDGGQASNRPSPPQPSSSTLTFAHPRPQVAIEVDGPMHYTSNRLIVKLPRARLRDRQLERVLGRGNLVCVPYWEWDALGTDQTTKCAYLARKLGLVAHAHARGE